MTWLTIVLASLLVLFLFAVLCQPNRKQMPPGPTGLPLIGNLLDLLKYPTPEYFAMWVKIHVTPSFPGEYFRAVAYMYIKYLISPTRILKISFCEQFYQLLLLMVTIIVSIKLQVKCSYWTWSIEKNVNQSATLCTSGCPANTDPSAACSLASVVWWCSARTTPCTWRTSGKETPVVSDQRAPSCRS